jgi:hypothetical protein
LHLSGSKDFDRIGMESFRRLARTCAYSEESLAHEIGAAVEQMRKVWAELEGQLPMPARLRAGLRRHMDSARL